MTTAEEQPLSDNRQTTVDQRPTDRFQLAYNLNQRPTNRFRLAYYPKPYEFYQRPASDGLHLTSDDQQQSINNPRPKSDYQQEMTDDQQTTTHVDDKVELKLYMKTQQIILEDLDENGFRKQNPSVEEVCQILMKNPNCMHSMDLKFIVPPKESKDKHFVPRTSLNDLSRYSMWKVTTILASGDDIGNKMNAPMIMDAKTAILRIGGVLDDNVDIRILPQFILDKYMGAINKNCIIIVLLTGKYISMCTKSNK